MITSNIRMGKKVITLTLVMPLFLVPGVYISAISDVVNFHMQQFAKFI